MNTLDVKAWTWLVVSCIAIGLVLLVSAGTVQFWQAWVYLAVIFICSVPVTLNMIKNPVLLQSRTKFGLSAEQRPIQRVIVRSLMLPVLAVFVVPGLDRRFEWSGMPAWLSLVGNVLVAASIWMSTRVFKENTFGSSIIEVVKDQKVISSGPYAVVRNPMYTSAVLFFLAMGLALGSYWALIPALLTAPGFAWRLLDEEQFLAKNLPGYTAYCAKVRWHLLPGVF